MICRSGTIIAETIDRRNEAEKTPQPTDASKVDFQIFRKFLPTGVTRIHRDDDGETLVQRHFVSVSEKKFFLAFAFRLQNALNLLSGNGKHRQIDSIESANERRVSDQVDRRFTRRNSPNSR